MNILIWSAPWAAHGDPLFYRNCLRKHLVPQANLLVSAGCRVDLVLPELLASERSLIDAAIHVIDIPLSIQLELVGHLSDPSSKLYQAQDIPLIKRLERGLAKMLAPSYDVVLLWETPVPFLEKLYPDALIINQMPGAFSRPPYPHTVTFDPVGLYKSGALFLNAERIQTSCADKSNLALAKDFSSQVRHSINAIQPFERSSLDPKGKFDKLILLPLQVSAHYSFQVDTEYENQTDFLLDVLNQTEENVGVVVTQYVTPRVADTVLSKDVVGVLRSKWPNFIYREEFDRTTSVSQYLLPLVDEVVTCSSSIGLQAMAWPRSLVVSQDTFLGPFATKSATVSELSERDRFDNTLAFLLGRNQPLAAAVVQDKKFLLQLLEEMLARKRIGAKGIDLLPAFNEIDVDYHRKLLESFTTDRAARGLERSTERWSARQTELSKFNRAISDPDINVITFDVFDTLIKRPTEVPADAYKFLERRALELTNGIAEDFARVRLNAEVETREMTNKGEISLDEIYSSIKSYYGLSDELVNNLKLAETEMEINLIQPRVFGQRLWQMAINSGKPVYLISDMYLSSHVIERMMIKSGYTSYQKLYLSSVYGVRKKEGGLFDIVVDDLKISPTAILHIGDNKVADVEKAQERGIRTFRLLRAVDRMRGSDHYKNIYPARSGAGERARSAIAGLTAHALFDAPSGEHEKTSHFQGNPFNLGYAALGPMITGFVLWLGRQAKRDGITKLYFLSREGWLLKQMYDSLHPVEEGAVPSAYLYASRRATRVASLQGKGDVLALAGQPFKAGVTAGELLAGRFGIAASDVTAGTWVATGYTGPDDKLKSDTEGRIKFTGLCALVSEEILACAKRERKDYLAYLGESGFVTEAFPAVVDIGWRANMQGAFGELIGKPLTGYYYATLQGAEVWKTKGHQIWAYVGDMLAINHPSDAVKNRQFLEYITCHVEPSLIRIEQKNGNLVPVFRSEENNGARRLLIEEIHHGAIQFARDFQSEFSHVAEQIWIDPFLGDRTFSSFVNQPSKIDAALFVGHHFEDALGGVNRQYIVKPIAKGALTESVWKVGASVIYPQVKLIPTTDKLKVAKVDSLQSHRPSNDAVESFANKLEWRVIKTFSNDRKFAKYERDRVGFFQDARNPVIRAWFKWNS